MEGRSVRGRPPRFCGAACRAAAYRRRRQGQPESLPRWPHARGQLRLSGADFWETRRDAPAGVRATAREERARQAAVRRALRRWDSAFATAERLHVLRGAPAPTPAAVAAWREIAAAAAECARVQAPGGPWTPVQESAERAVVLLTSPHLTRAEHRRRQREERKRAQAAGLVSRPRDGSLSRDATAPGVNRPRSETPRTPSSQLTQATPPHPTPSSTSSRACIRLLSLHLSSASIALLSRHRSFTSHTLAPTGAHDLLASRKGQDVEEFDAGGEPGAASADVAKISLRSHALDRMVVYAECGHPGRLITQASHDPVLSRTLKLQVEHHCHHSPLVSTGR